MTASDSETLLFLKTDVSALKVVIDFFHLLICLEDCVLFTLQVQQARTTFYIFLSDSINERNCSCMKIKI